MALNWRRYGLKSKPKKRCYDWWWLLGSLHCTKWREPKYPHVKPYVDGWRDKEEEDHAFWGDHDFLFGD
jgi:hypothetical protein